MTSSEQVAAELERQEKVESRLVSKHVEGIMVYDVEWVEESISQLSKNRALIRALMAEREAGMAHDDAGEFSMALIDKVIEAQVAADAAIEAFTAQEPK